MKKALLSLLSFAIVLALFAGGNSASAATYTEAEKLVKTAEGYAGTLKWEISYENTKTIKYPNMKVYNQTKDSLQKAQSAVNTLSSGTKKTALQTRLNNNVKLHLTRAAAYIDAITAGEKIKSVQIELKNNLDDGYFDETTEELYHSLSFEIRKQAILLYRVYGKSTRDAILAKYKAPAEKVKNEAAIPVTVLMNLDDAATTKVSAERNAAFKSAISWLSKVNNELYYESLTNALYETAFEVEEKFYDNPKYNVYTIDYVDANTISVLFDNNTEDGELVEFDLEQSLVDFEPQYFTFENAGRTYSAVITSVTYEEEEDVTYLMWAVTDVQ
jgi:SbsC C-terminal domain